MLACELVASLRAVRQHGDQLNESITAIVERCSPVPDLAADHALIDDITAAAAVLPSL
jgi:hypothetical protein